MSRAAAGPSRDLTGVDVLDGGPVGIGVGAKAAACDHHFTDTLLFGGAILALTSATARTD
jgi:hypothetical protein